MIVKRLGGFLSCICTASPSMADCDDPPGASRDFYKELSGTPHSFWREVYMSKLLWSTGSCMCEAGHRAGMRQNHSVPA